MGKLVIDGTNLVLGRLGTIVAKEALLGKSVDIVNCEKCVIKGRKEEILKRYKEKFARGIPAKGPFLYKRPNMFVKRTIRGMLNYKHGRGKEAFKRLKCHIGVPESLKEAGFTTFGSINVEKQKILRNPGNVKIGELCNLLGWKRI